MRTGVGWGAREQLTFVAVLSHGKVQHLDMTGTYAKCRVAGVRNVIPAIVETNLTTSQLARLHCSQRPSTQGPTDPCVAQLVP